MLIRSQNKNVVFDMTGSNIEINSRNEIHGYGFGFECKSSFFRLWL